MSVCGTSQLAGREKHPGFPLPCPLHGPPAFQHPALEKGYLSLWWDMGAGTAPSVCPRAAQVWMEQCWGRGGFATIKQRTEHFWTLQEPPREQGCRQWGTHGAVSIQLCRCTQVHSPHPTSVAPTCPTALSLPNPRPCCPHVSPMGIRLPRLIWEMLCKIRIHTHIHTHIHTYTHIHASSISGKKNPLKKKKLILPALSKSAVAGKSRRGTN